MQPSALKFRVEDVLGLENNDLKDNFFGFSDSMADQAEVCEKCNPLRTYCSSPKSNRARALKAKTKTACSLRRRLGNAETPKLPIVSIRLEREEELPRLKGLNSHEKPDRHCTASTDPCSPTYVFIFANSHGHNFACRVDSEADDIAISDTIVKFLGDNGNFLSPMLSMNDKHFEALTGTVSNLWGKLKSVRS